jgi:SAM-dependent methyltransferase
MMPINWLLQRIFYKPFTNIRDLILSQKNATYKQFKHHVNQHYRVLNAYDIARLIGKDDTEIYYGETPIYVINHVMQRISSLNINRLIDLGCGRGLLSAWISYQFNIDVTGIDTNIFFISAANQSLDRSHKNGRLRYAVMDLYKAPIAQYDGVIINTLLMSSDEITQLQNWFDEQKKQFVLIVIGSDHFSHYNCLYNERHLFPWGSTTVTVQRKS